MSAPIEPGAGSLPEGVAAQVTTPPVSDSIRRSFGSRVGLRTKLLSLTLIPLIPLALLNALGLFYVSHMHSVDLEQRLERAATVWEERIEDLSELAQQGARALAASKDVERALLRNHWGAARGALRTAVLPDPDLRALLIDSDGRLLADSKGLGLDRPVPGPLFAKALKGEAAQGLGVVDGVPWAGYVQPLRVVGGVEGAVAVGVHLDPALVQRFAEQSQTAVVLVEPGGAPSVTSLPELPWLPPEPRPVESPLDEGQRSVQLRPVAVELPGEAVLRCYVGLDQSDVARTTSNLLLALTVLFCLLLVTILAITLSLSDRIVAALRYVVEKMRLLQEGEYQKIDPVRGRDEIAFLGHGFNEMINGLAERDFVRETFGRYMSREVARALLDDPEGLRLGGEACEVTILMVDLRGFTSFSGTHSPEEVVRVLNIWLGRMSEIIDESEGTVIEFLGDAILALFGAPMARPGDALRAVACTVSMQQAMEDVNRTLAEQGIPPLHMGIGLATGVVVAGNIGSETRAKYGVVGQPVNLASRVEGFTVGDDILIAQSTLDAAGDAVQTGPARHVKVKGSEKLLAIYPVLGVGAPYELRVPSADAPAEQRHTLPRGSVAHLWPIHGKEVAERPLEAPAVELGSNTLLVVPPAPLVQWSDLKLQLRAGGQETSPTLYGKVLEVELGERKDATLVRLTRVAPGDREFLDRLLDEASAG